MVKFTVIIPTYNYGHYIKECLNSLLLQTYKNWECIIVDNASTDNTEQLCSEFLSDVRFLYTRLSENKGPSFARNFALKKAIGSFILFLDADDLIEPLKLQAAAAILSNTNVDFVFTDYAYFNTENVEQKQIITFKNRYKGGIVKTELINTDLISENLFAISCVVCNIKILKEANFFDESILYNEDWDLWLRISFNDVVYYYDDSLNSATLIRNHNTSHSKDRFSMYVAGLIVCLKNRHLLNSNQQKIFNKKILYHLHILKLNLIQFHYYQNEKFIFAVHKINQYPILNNQLKLYRNQKWFLPKFFVPLVINYLKVKYYISSKCL